MSHSLCPWLSLFPRHCPTLVCFGTSSSLSQKMIFFASSWADISSAGCFSSGPLASDVWMNTGTEPCHGCSWRAALRNPRGHHSPDITSARATSSSGPSDATVPPRQEMCQQEPCLWRLCPLPSLGKALGKMLFHISSSCPQRHRKALK